MFTKKSIVRVFAIALVVLLMSSTASARLLQAALGTGFTYQGKLTDGGAPANGTYDLEFKLYDALSGGAQVGSTVTQDDMTVTNGLFTAQLDFGDVFDGAALYLEIGVRPGIDTGAYTPLTPRQTLSATPYAIYAAKAPWSGITNMPAAFADGVDNGSAYANVKVVAKSGGDFTTITAALDSITDANDTNRYLVKVAPGVYTERVTMKEYVDIEGSGELTTKITFTGSAGYDNGTVVGANNAELRFLTVENTGSAFIAIAIYNSNVAPRLTHVTANATGGINETYGVYNNGSSPTMTHITANASGAILNHGVKNLYSSPTMTNVIASASGGPSNNYGLYNFFSPSTMTNVTANASGGTDSYGVTNYNCSPTMIDVITSGSGGTTLNIGVRNDDLSPLMTNITAHASGGTNSYGIRNDYSASPIINNSVINADDATNTYGIYNTAGVAGTVRINNSQISASTAAILNSSGFAVFVGNSQLSGGVVAGSGTLTCIGVYNASYIALNSTCQ